MGDLRQGPRHRAWNPLEWESTGGLQWLLSTQPASLPPLPLHYIDTIDLPPTGPDGFMDDIVATYVKDLLNLRVAHYLSGQCEIRRTNLSLPAQKIRINWARSFFLLLLAGATALAIWDWLICLELEYRFIWKARLSAGKFLYLIHRYPLIIISVIGIHCE